MARLNWRLFLSFLYANTKIAALGMNQSWPLLYPFHAIRRRVMLTSDQGALTQLYAATSLEVEEKDLK